MRVARFALALALGCAGRTPTDSVGSADSSDTTAATSSTSDATATADGGTDAESGTDTDSGDSGGTDTGGAPACVDIATGSLTDTVTVPHERDTALGVSLELEGLNVDGVTGGATLVVRFVCTSDGSFLHEGVYDEGDGPAFLIDDLGTTHEVSFAWVWVSGETVEFSVAVMDA